MENFDKTTSSIARLETELESAQNCGHERIELRVKTASDGSKRYGWQCLRCGRTISKDGKLWIPARDIEDIQSLVPYDENLSETYSQIKTALYQQLSETRWSSNYQHFQENYPEYLQSEVWQKKRQLVLRRAGYMCEGCGINKATIVHHKTYQHKFDELLFELVAVCEDCHDKLHPEHNDG